MKPPVLRLEYQNNLDRQQALLARLMELEGATDDDSIAERWRIGDMMDALREDLRKRIR